MYLARKEALGSLRHCIPAGAEEHVGALHHMVRCGCHRAQAGGGHGHHACTRTSSACGPLHECTSQDVLGSDPVTSLHRLVDACVAWFQAALACRVAGKRQQLQVAAG